MRPESFAPILANMSAPPRSTVMLPRLVPGNAAAKALSTLPKNSSGLNIEAVRKIPVGPGGGKLLSHALCLTHVELPTALCAYLRLPFVAPSLAAPLGLARALVAIARNASAMPPLHSPGRAARLELGRLAEVPEGVLVQELTGHLEAIQWPGWVPRVAFVMPFGRDIATGLEQKRPPTAPKGICCPLLAARMVSAIRGPVFLRDAAPALSNLLNIWSGDTPSGIWDIWLPVRPGEVTPLLPVVAAARGAGS